LQLRVTGGLRAPGKSLAGKLYSLDKLAIIKIITLVPMRRRKK